MEIDVNATIVPDSCTIWRVFPGKNYRFLSTFLSKSVFFLEQPQLQIDPLTVEDDLYLGSKVFAADILAYDRRKNGNLSEKLPDWEDFKNIVPDADLNRKVGATLDFYLVAKEGDLIIVPDHKARGNVYIGTIASDQSEILSVEGIGNYEGLYFQAGPVKWIARVDDNSLSPRLSRSLRHEHAFSEVKQDFYNEIYSLAYGNFIGNGVYSSVVLNGNDEFRDVDNTLIGVIFKLSAQACMVFDEGGEKVQIGSLFDFLIDEPELQYTCFLSAEYHSPGYSRYAGPKGTALVAVSVIAGMLALAETSSADEFKSAVGNIKLVNSTNGNPVDCPKELQGPAELLFQSIDGDKLRKACHNLAEAADRARLKIRSKVKEVKN